jgi:hypothetical protein
MAPMMQRRFDDDDEVFDASVFDPKFYPRRVYRDGCGPTVRLMLTDAADHNGRKTMTTYIALGRSRQHSAS